MTYNGGIPSEVEGDDDDIGLPATTMLMQLVREERPHYPSTITPILDDILVQLKEFFRDPEAIMESLDENEGVVRLQIERANECAMVIVSRMLIDEYALINTWRYNQDGQILMIFPVP